MARLSPLMILPPALFLGLAAIFAMGMERGGDPQDLPSAFIGRSAPEVTADTLPGYPGVTQGGLTGGELTLVNFWASWCPPCRAEHPNLLKLQSEGLRIVGVNFGDQQDDALKYLRDEGNPFAAIAFDPRRRTAVDWGVAAPPESFLVDGTDRVVFKFIGPLVGDDFTQRFLPALAAAKGGG